MIRRDHVAGLVAGFFAGIAGGFFGVGGGVVIIPLLTGHFRLTQHQAHGTSLAVIGAASLVSMLVYALHGNVAWGTAAIIGLASIATSGLGVRLAGRTSPEGLKRAFAVLLALLAIRLLWGTPASAAAANQGGIGGAALVVVLGFAVGLLSAYMGVGGGILIVPALTAFFGWPQQLAQGTSLAAILVVAPVGSFQHAKRGNVITRLVPALAIGAAIGGPLASLLAQRLDHLFLTRCFAVFLLANAVLTWRRASKPGVAEAA